APFTAKQVTATLDAPAEVPGGSSFQVGWEGPANEGDLLTVALLGADPGTYSSHTFAQFGNPATLTAPVDVGTYEIRYVAAAGGGVLARRPLEVVAAAVSVTAPAEVMAGSNVSVAWQGPDGQGDLVVFALEGAPPGSFLSYAFTAWG